MIRSKNKGLDALIPIQSPGETLSRVEIKKVLEALDKLLSRLPDEQLEEFAKSKDYERYVKLLKEYDVK